MPTLQAFYEAVQHEALVLSLPGDVSSFNPEDPHQLSVPSRGLPRLRRLTDRPLEPLLRIVSARGRVLLADEPDYAERLSPDELPRAEWTRAPISNVWAYWTARISGKSKGRAHIRVNALLRAPRNQIPDEWLEFLLWHELCHHLTPNQGHDAEFRRLEALWPNAARLEHEINELALTYQLDAA